MLPDLVAEDTPKRAPGRPKGLPKTGGRKPGTGNKLPEELRRFINQRGRPLEFLAAIADGRKVTAADPDNPSSKRSVYPSLAERIAAARVLLNKVLPDLKAVELTGADSGPLQQEVRDLTPLESARRIAFIMAQAQQELEKSKHSSE